MTGDISPVVDRARTIAADIRRPAISSRHHLLIADDDEDIRMLVFEHLMAEGYALSQAQDGAGIRDALAMQSIDLVVLDLSLPDCDGITLCREMRASGYRGAIIMVTARNTPIDRIVGLEIGADDYLSKPFEPRELTIRIRKLLERARQGTPPDGRHVQIDGWTLDRTKRRLKSPDGTMVMLSGTEFEILSRLVKQPGTAIARRDLMPERAATAAFDRTIDNQISRLRSKLAPDGDSLIRTIRGKGYVLTASVTPR